MSKFDLCDQKDAELAKRKIQGFLQEKYDKWVSSLDLSKLETAKTNDSSSGFSFFGTYTRNIDLSILGIDRIELKIQRVIHKASGITHALLPFYLNACSSCPAFSIDEFFKKRAKGKSILKAAIIAGISLSSAQMALKREEEFKKLLPNEAVSWGPQKRRRHCLKKLFRNWLQSELMNKRKVPIIALTV